MNGLSNRRCRHGFTVLEILVASALTVVLAGLVVGLTASLLRGWNAQTAGLGRDTDLALARQWLREDLAAAVLPRDGRAGLWLSQEEGRQTLRLLLEAPGGEGLERVEWVLAPLDALGQPGGEVFSLFRFHEGVDPTSLAPFDEPGRRAQEAQDWWSGFVAGNLLRPRFWFGWEGLADGTPDRISEGGLALPGLLPGAPAFATKPDHVGLRAGALTAGAVRRPDDFRGEGLPLDALLARDALALDWRFTVLPLE
ncbi:MAG: type II secretion system protein J [Opitutales bacterium]